MARSSRRSKASGLPHLIVGLTLGLAVAAGVYFSDVRSGAGLPETIDRALRSQSSASADDGRPAAQSSAGPSTREASGAAPAAAGTSAARATSGTAAARPAGDASRTSSATPVNEEPSFDFYEILPQSEVRVSEDVEPPTRPAARAARSPTATAPTVGTPATAASPAAAAPGSYVLQTGSFRSHADADRMQASLALLGVESRIQKVAIAGGEFHRVRIGPISNLDDLDRIRSVLTQAGIESLMMKVE